MTHKKFFVGMAVLASVSLFVISCPAEVDERRIEVPYTVAKAADLKGLQILLDDPGITTVTYVGTLVIDIVTVIPQVFVPSGKTLVAKSGVILNRGTFVVAGSLELGDSRINATEGVVIGSEAVLEKVDSGGESVNKIPIQDGSETIVVSNANPGLTAVRAAKLTISGEPTSATNINSGELGSGVLYVFGDVTVSDAITSDEVMIVVFGNAAVTAAQDKAVNWSITGSLDAQETPTDSGLMFSVGGKAEFQKALTVGKSGNSMLMVSFGGAATFRSTVSFKTPVQFGGAATFDDAVEFEGGAAFVPGSVVTLTTANSVITLKNKTYLFVYDDSLPNFYTHIYASADSSSTNAVFTPAAGTTLTFARTGITQSGTGNTHQIQIGGEAELIHMISWTVASENGHAGTLLLDDSAVLKLGVDGSYLAELVLAGAAGTDGAKLAGAGKVVFGNASITGGASGAWQAQGAGTSIILGATETVTGTGTGPVLAALNDNGAVITLAEGHDNNDAAALTVTNATIDIAAKGAVVFPYVGTTPATLVLKGGSDTPGALKLGNGNETLTNTHLKDGSHSVAITGASPVIRGTTSSGVAGLISGGAATPDNDATITGKTESNDVTVKAGATLEGSAS